MLKITVAKYGWERTNPLGDDSSTYAWGRLPFDINGNGNTTDTNLSEAGDLSATPPYKSPGDVNLDGDTDDTNISEADAATRTYEIQLSALIAKEGAEFNLNGPKYVDMARDMIQAERNKLAVLIDSDQLVGQQAVIWQKIQEILMVYVFQADKPRVGAAGQGFAGRLPVQVSGNYDKSSALNRIDNILHALSSASNLEEALDPDEDGLFVEDDNTPFAGRGSGDIWGEKDSQVKAWIGTTDYTRFGVWRVRRSRNALRATIQGSTGSAAGNQAWDNAELEAFAYSPLPKSVVLNTNSPNYPSGATATYTGKTVAFVDTIAATGAKAGAVTGAAGYEGVVDMTVKWGKEVDGTTDLTGGQIGAQIQTVLSGLTNVNGDILTHSGNPVKDMVFANVAFTTDTDNVLDFSDTGTLITINYMDRNATAGGTSAATFEGTFVGASTDGPLGVIGLYEITNFGTVSGTAITIDGAFGADLP